MWICLGILCILQIWSSQADLIFYINDFVVGAYDTSYISHLHAKVNEKVDDNTVTTNFTIIKQFPEDCIACFSVLGFAVSEYKMDTGIDACSNLCDVFADEIILGPFFECVGINEDECPPLEGSYICEDYYPDTENMPDSFPSGDYRAKITIECDDSLVLESHVDFQIE